MKFERRGLALYIQVVRKGIEFEEWNAIRRHNYVMWGLHWRARCGKLKRQTPHMHLINYFYFNATR